MACPNACLTYDDGGMDCQYYDVKIVRARKMHVCVECRQQIQPGDLYESVHACWDHEPDHLKTCLMCVDIRNALRCRYKVQGQEDEERRGGFNHCNLWDDIDSYVLPVLGFACLEEMQPRSKAYMIRRWQELKELPSPKSGELIYASS